MRFLTGNIVSFLVFLAPVPTFYNIYKKKSSEGFQSIPYVVSLFSASLLLYYAFLKTNAYLIVSINAFGCVVETVYLFMYVIYASNKAKMLTVKLVLLFNVGLLGIIMVVSLALTKDAKRVTLVGWCCAVINIAVFAAPLSIMRRVIRTKSVEFMPFNLSFFLTLCATMWFFYGFFIRDYYIALPNVLGFLFGIVQMILYFIYKNANKGVEMNEKLEGAMKQKEGIEMKMERVENKNIKSGAHKHEDLENRKV
ncbi:hypothetical protein ACH5RR_003057 [Cinchona calisaya]|uniref:Bidirectional sugar transporter SWEET n=1 Tax=Cinchona calisaya TaxID=153742 RepID=A0ABD3ATT0_9GENT